MATEGTHESTLDEDTKRALLDSIPHTDDDDEDDGVAALGNPGVAVQASAARKRTSSDMSDSSSGSGNNDKTNEKKKIKSTKNTNNPQTPKRRNNTQRIQELAQNRLSKWAARLFDPDRPRGLVEAPQVIPLSDEFLQDFGKREKAFDMARGVDLEIDRAIRDDDDDSLYGDTAAAESVGTKSNDKSSNGQGFKVKIVNIKFTTTQTDLMKACSAFGPVTQLNLIMDENQVVDDSNDAPLLNQGHAYVTFDTEEAAKACVEGLTELDGRPLRIDILGATASRSSGKSRASSGGVALSSRYYAKDISTKCYRCGEVGHRESDCTNPARAKPCPICAGIDHELRNCPIKAICFNCGIPGHVSRSCNVARGAPPPSICTVCFQKGHTKLNCRQSYRDAANVSQKAVCMVCGEEGHYLCQQLKWFFGVQGVSCGNCGLSGHIGEECRRPNVDTLGRDEDLAKMEVERVVQEEDFATSSRRQRDQNKQQRRRVQSVPPRNRNNSSSQYQPRDPRGRR